MTSHPIHRRLAVISDSQAGWAFASRIRSVKYFQKQWEKRAREQPKVVERAHRDFVVEGGYIDRLPLACLKVGIVDAAEIWTHWRGDDPPETDLGEVG